MNYTQIFGYILLVIAMGASIIVGGPILLAALAVVVFLSLRQWSETIFNIDRSAFNILVLASIVYLAEVFLTRGAVSAQLVPLFATIILFGWKIYIRETEDLFETVARLVLVFIMVPYSFGFLILLRDLPDAVGLWVTPAAFVGPLVIAGAWWLGRAWHWKQLTTMSVSIIIGAVVMTLFMTRAEFLTKLSTVFISSLIAAMAGYLGIIIYESIRNNRKEPNWLAVIFSSMFLVPVVYFVMTIIG